ncbi:MAG: universal stress protein [Burkholderiaceae bacterium]
MSYKTILVHVDNSIGSQCRYQLAASIAKSQDAHLVGVAATGVSRFIQTPVSGDSDPEAVKYLVAPVERYRKKAQDALQGFTDFVRDKGAVHEELLIDDEPYDALKLLSRYSDLIVVAQSDVNDPAMTNMMDFPEYIALNSGRPVLIVPQRGTVCSGIGRVLIAWDASLSAARAVADALPLLKAAEQVTVAIFNPATKPDVVSQLPGADITLYLGRHGINAEVMQEKTNIEIGDALLRLASEKQADLIVMGCYGHTRFREILLGGVTRSMLERASIPVLVAH